MYAIGIDIGGTSIKFAKVEENGSILSRAQKPTPVKDPAALADRIAELIRENAGNSFDGPIGVACAGDVSNVTGLVTADNLGWEQAPLKALLTERLGRPVFLEQDAHAAMMAEWESGSLKGEKNALYLTFGTGIGGGAIIDGRPYRELEPDASEYGHMIVHAGGEPCPCGESGCYERYASTSALVRRAEGFSSAKEVLEAVKAGNESVLPVWNAYIEEVCVGLVNLLTIFAPDALSIGGGISGAGEFFLRSIKAGMEKHASYRRYYHATDIRLAVFGNDAGVLGAAAAARREQNGENVNHRKAIQERSERSGSERNSESGGSHAVIAPGGLGGDR